MVDELCRVEGKGWYQSRHAPFCPKGISHYRSDTQPVLSLVHHGQVFSGLKGNLLTDLESSKCIRSCNACVKPARMHRLIGGRSVTQGLLIASSAMPVGENLLSIRVRNARKLGVSRLWIAEAPQVKVANCVLSSELFVRQFSSSGVQCWCWTGGVLHFSWEELFRTGCDLRPR